MSTFVRLVLIAELGEVELGRGDGHHELERVAAADVHVLRHRAEAVRGVQVTVHEAMVVAAPVAFAAEAPEDAAAKVVDVGALGVLEVAEEALAGEVQHEELFVAVAAILDDGTVALGLFSHVHELPALVDGDGGGDFDEGVLALFHDLEGHRHVPLPRGGDEDDVDVVAFEHLFPRVLVAEIHRGFLAGDLLDVGSGALGPGFNDVADGDDFGERDVRRRVHVGTPAVEADDGDPDFLDGLGRQVPDGLVASRARTSRRDVARVEEFEVAGVRLGFGRRDGAEAKAEAGEGAEFKEVATIGVFGEVHGGKRCQWLAVSGWETIVMGAGVQETMGSGLRVFQPPRVKSG